MTNTPAIWTVTALNRYIRQQFESDYRLQDITIEGEISNLSTPRSGHIYFTLKDDSAALKAVIWRAQAAHLPAIPRVGDRVRAHGAISVYEAGGQYQLYADRLELAGAGDLYQRFEALKQKLNAEGLFDETRKRPLPAWPGTIGIVTSATGAALRDILNVLRRRWPLATAIVYPTAVQGDHAPAQIIAALRRVYQASPDVLLVSRGGGSAEDLWCFNDEQVVRTLAESPVPVVSGIGHEIDFTLADFVADQRAPTPSAAAEIATPDQVQLHSELLDRRRQLGSAMQRSITTGRERLAALDSHFRSRSPAIRIASARQQIDNLTDKAQLLIQRHLERRRAQLARQTHTLAALSPLTTLQRGYAIVTRPDEQTIIRSPTDVAPGDPLAVRVAGGSFSVTVSGDTPSDKS